MTDIILEKFDSRPDYSRIGRLHTVDIIIPVYKPGKKFIRLLEMLRKQTYSYHSLIIINTVPGRLSGNDKLPAQIGQALLAMPEVKLKHIEKQDFDHAATRAMAVRMSDADAFICLTDDAVPQDEYLIERLMDKLYADSSTGMTYGRQLAAPDCREAERFTRLFNYPDKSSVKSADDIARLGIKAYFASDVCCAYKRFVYDEVGGFPDKAIFNEDMIIASKVLKAGYNIAYAADAKVIHSHNYTALQQFHRNFDLGVSQAMHPEVFAGIRSEGEGIRMVKASAAHLAGKGKFLELPGLFTASAFKYAGYRLGKAWKKLPYGLVYRCALNKNFVRKYLRGKNTGA